MFLGYFRPGVKFSLTSMRRSPQSRSDLRRRGLICGSAVGSRHVSGWPAIGPAIEMAAHSRPDEKAADTLQHTEPRASRELLSRRQGGRHGGDPRYSGQRAPLPLGQRSRDEEGRVCVEQGDPWGAPRSVKSRRRLTGKRGAQPFGALAATRNQCEDRSSHNARAWAG